MDEMMKTMMMQLGSESAADEAGRAPPDMPDLSKLITQMTSSMMNNPNMQKLMGGGSQHVQTNKPKLLTHRLCVSLQELFNGAEKSIKMKRQVYNAETNKTSWEKCTVPLTITRGMRFNDAILVPGVGDMLKDKEPGDLEVKLGMDNGERGIFIVEEDNLKIEANIPLQSLFSYTMTFEHLDGNEVTLIHCDHCRPLTGKWTVSGLGLPKQDGSFGDLIFDASVELPSKLEDLLSVKACSEVIEEGPNCYRLTC